MQQTRQTGTIIAERNARQLFQVTITNIPGDVKLSYPYLLGTERENESEYNIAFYFAPNATSLDSITDASSIVRIATSYTNGSDTIRFDRQYASQFYVPNMFNRVRVQKLNYYGERLAVRNLPCSRPIPIRIETGTEHSTYGTQRGKCTATPLL